MTKYQQSLKYMNNVIKNPKNQYFKNKYLIVFYDKDDEFLVSVFDNLRDICKYKGLEVTNYNVRNLNIELLLALKRDDHYTKLLDGSPMHVYLVDIKDDEEEDI